MALQISDGGERRCKMASRILTGENGLLTGDLGASGGSEGLWGPLGASEALWGPLGALGASGGSGGSMGFWGLSELLGPLAGCCLLLAWDGLGWLLGDVWQAHDALSI